MRIKADWRTRYRPGSPKWCEAYRAHKEATAKKLKSMSLAKLRAIATVETVKGMGYDLACAYGNKVCEHIRTKQRQELRRA